ncbi:ATBF1 [Mytilus coruscus]|uniref:ATBF1 n=1 Tax=Mytilus coruscus TaxID=42192 RepID=A0A6J8BDZ0_MYTCO|nr:ATBF1 [Mytilus coruscus]
MRLYTATDLEMPLYTATDLEMPLYTATDLEMPLYTATDIEMPLYTVTDLEMPLYTATDLEMPLYTATDLVMPFSELSGCFNPFKKKLKSMITNVDQAYPKLLSEKLHNKFCKLLLGVGNSELGRFLLHFDIAKSMIRYWHMLENLGSSFPLLKEACLDSKLLHESTIPLWYGSLNFFLKNVKGVGSLGSASNYSFKFLYKKNLYQYYEDQWRLQMHNCADGKLCRYNTFKTNFGLERYPIP